MMNANEDSEVTAHAQSDHEPSTMPQLPPEEEQSLSMLEQAE